MEKVLLIGKYSIVEPLGLMFLAGALRDEGHEVKIFLFKESDGSDIIPSVCNSDFSFVGFSCYTGIHKTIYRKADILREVAPVIIGGPHTTGFMMDCKDHADYVVPGEGIESIRSIINKLVKPGIIFTPYLVSPEYIPLPDRSSVYESYPELGSSKIKSVITSMGCSFNCSYCFNDSFRKLYSQFKVRQRPVEAIIEECRTLDLDTTELIYFQDDCFGTQIPWLEKFAVNYKLKINLPFHCQLRPEAVTPIRMHLLKEAGCHGITMAIETYNDCVRKELLNRHHAIDQIRNAGALIKSYGFKFRTEQMLGLPETSIEDELDLLSLNIDLNPDIAWTSVFVPYLGTSLGDWCKANAWYNGSNDDIEDSFFSDTRLNFDAVRQYETNMLHRIFSTCAKITQGRELAEKYIKEGTKNIDSWYKILKQHLYDSCLYKI